MEDYLAGRKGGGMAMGGGIALGQPAAPVAASGGLFGAAPGATSQSTSLFGQTQAKPLFGSECFRFRDCIARHADDLRHGRADDVVDLALRPIHRNPVNRRALRPAEAGDYWTLRHAVDAIRLRHGREWRAVREQADG